MKGNGTGRLSLSRIFPGQNYNFCPCPGSVPGKIFDFCPGPGSAFKTVLNTEILQERKGKIAELWAVWPMNHWLGGPYWCVLERLEWVKATTLSLACHFFDFVSKNALQNGIEIRPNLTWCCFSGRRDEIRRNWTNSLGVIWKERVKCDFIRRTRESRGKISQSANGRENSAFFHSGQTQNIRDSTQFFIWIIN